MTHLTRFHVPRYTRCTFYHRFYLRYVLPPHVTTHDLPRSYVVPGSTTFGCCCHALRYISSRLIAVPTHPVRFVYSFPFTDLLLFTVITVYRSPPRWFGADSLFVRLRSFVVPFRILRYTVCPFGYVAFGFDACTPRSFTLLRLRSVWLPDRIHLPLDYP